MHTRRWEQDREKQESYLQTPKGTVIHLPGLTKQTNGCGIQCSEEAMKKLIKIKSIYGSVKKSR